MIPEIILRFEFGDMRLLVEAVVVIFGKTGATDFGSFAFVVVVTVVVINCVVSVLPTDFVIIWLY